MVYINSMVVKGLLDFLWPVFWKFCSVLLGNLQAIKLHLKKAIFHTSAAFPVAESMSLTFKSFMIILFYL